MATDLDDELGDGDIHLRDKFQFEVKSEYSPIPGHANNHYTIEYFFFIPSALHVNRHTYAKKQFYYDQMSLIRLKTPHVPLSELSDLDDPHSPLAHITQLYKQASPPNEKAILRELKLYANMVRSVIRDRSQYLAEALRHPTLKSSAHIYSDIRQLCSEIAALRTSYHEFLHRFAPGWHNSRLDDYGHYIDEFVSLAVETHLTLLLKELQSIRDPEAAETAKEVTEKILWEGRHREATKEKSPFSDDPEKNREYFVYRSGLLKKFVWEALFLSISRKEPAKPFREFVAVMAAGIAMLMYLGFLTWQTGGIFVNSTAFIILAVFLYIIKDRLKDGIKNLSATFAARWFPDYRTDIETPDGEMKLGYLKEYFSFLGPKEIPQEIFLIRNTGFHTELERAERLESALYYKKDVTLYSEPERHKQTPEINDIFRFNILRFLLKASDAYKDHLEVDPKTGKLHTIRVPKVYHINIIMRRSFYDKEGKRCSDLRKFRIVADKEGIKRIEKVL
jgi:hypothetical protein